MRFQVSMKHLFGLMMGIALLFGAYPLWERWHRQNTLVNFINSETIYTPKETILFTQIAKSEFAWKTGLVSALGLSENNDYLCHIQSRNSNPFELFWDYTSANHRYRVYFLDICEPLLEISMGRSVSDCLIVVLDEQGKVVFWNKQTVDTSAFANVEVCDTKSEYNVVVHKIGGLKRVDIFINLNASPNITVHTEVSDP